MNKQIILVCGDDGTFNGEYILKEEGHQGKGRRHLAINEYCAMSKIY